MDGFSFLGLLPILEAGSERTMQPLLLIFVAALMTGTVVLAWTARRRGRETAAARADLSEAQHLRAKAEDALAAQTAHMAAQREELEGSALNLTQTNGLLAQAAGRFQEMFQGLPVACFCYNRDGRIMEWNRAFERLYEMENVLGQSIWETVYSRDDAPQIVEAIAAVLEGEAQEGVEWTHRRPDGSEAQLYCSIFPLRGVDGGITGGISADIDISQQHQAEEALRESEERLHALYNTTSQQNLSFEQKMDALLTAGSAQFGLEVGVLARAEGEVQEVIRAVSPGGVLTRGLVFPAETEIGRAALEKAHPGGGEEDGAEARIGAPIRVNGEVWGALGFAGFQPQARLFTSGDRELVRLMAQWIGGEVARQQAEEAVRESEERFRSAIASMSEGLIVMDREGAIRLCNESAEGILGLTRSEIKEWRPLNPDYVAHREDGTPFPQGSYPLFVSLRGGKPQRNVVTGLPKSSGGLLWVSVNSNPLFRPGDDAPYAVVATFSDISERRRYEAQITAHMAQIEEYATVLEFQKTQLEGANAQLEALAMRDGLTGLGNRRAFEHRLAHEMDRVGRYSYPLSLLMLDVDRFKEYNDTFGHQAGDEVLITLARVLEAEGRETDFFARYGGEEFAVLLPHTDSAGAMTMAERLRAALEAAAWNGRAVTASLGAATFTPAMADERSLISAADAALYAAKTAGRNRVAHAQAAGVTEHALCGA